MTTPFKDKLNSISFGAGRKPRVKVEDGVKHVELQSDTDGSYAGFHTHHADGTFDCTMKAEPINTTLEGAYK